MISGDSHSHGYLLASDYNLTWTALRSCETGLVSSMMTVGWDVSRSSARRLVAKLVEIRFLEFDPLNTARDRFQQSSKPKYLTMLTLLH